MIIGIDLGTTNSLVSYFTDEGPKIIPNRLGKYVTPSIVSIDENEQVYVGETAKERELLYPGTSASVFKRDMGSKRKYRLGNERFTAEELSSFVLRSLKEDAEVYLNEPITEAVISVPAYFNDIRRRATKRAGELAGLKVDRIISEPTAAAIAYGLYQDKSNKKYLVFDLGGGTFDVSILELYNSIIEVRAVAGDNFLGGEDFTDVLEQKFYKDNEQVNKDSLGEKAKKYISNQMELCKLELSKSKNIEKTFQIEGIEARFNMNINTYEELCEELFERIRIPVRRSLADANIRTRDIDKVVLIGGATKQPIIRKFVSKLFGVLPDTSINPDETVVLGAAIQAAMKERNKSIREVILTDVCPFTLGTEVVVDLGENWIEDGHFCPIIERNTTIPASRTERLYTAYDKQKEIRIKVLQGESRFAKNNLSLGELLIKVPKGKKGEESVDVTYTYDVNSILEVIVKVVSTGETKKQVIKGRHTNMTDEEIKERFEELSYLKIAPREREENKLLLLKGERLYEEALNTNRQRIDRELHEFERALDSQERDKIEGARRRFKDFLDKFEI